MCHLTHDVESNKATTTTTATTTQEIKMFKKTRFKYIKLELFTISKHNKKTKQSIKKNTPTKPT